MLNEIKSYIPTDKKLNIIDATFGGGGYSESLLENFNINKLIAIDRDRITKIFADELSKKIWQILSISLERREILEELQEI